MISGYAFLRSAGCKNCHRAILNALVFPAGSRTGPIRRLEDLRAHDGSKARTLATSQTFSQSDPWEDADAKLRLSKEEGIVTGKPIKSKAPSSSKKETPWYLQVDPPQAERNPLLDRQRIPDVPLDAPALLSPILEFISQELGLDDLSLLDLRKVNPPPALGANLLMVIGSTRSEKHLHVSADRFRNWMKTTHDIRVSTDGLIGRGELKVRLRRKAKRARILSRVGSIETGNQDDGTRSGWVCATADDIEAPTKSEEDAQLPEGYVGFGGETLGTKLVVQMLTREKREDLDLEELWGKVLWRYERKEAKILEYLSEANDILRTDSTIVTRGNDIFSTTTQNAPGLSKVPNVSKLHVRHLHSASSHQVRAMTSLPSTRATTHETEDRANQAEDTDDLRLSSSALGSSKQDETHFLPTGGELTSLVKLEAHISAIKDMSQHEARQALGKSASDRESTPFLRSFYSSLPLFLSVEDWKYLLRLICYGMDVGALGYDKQHLLEAFTEARSSLINIPAETYVMVLKVLLKPSDVSGKKGQPYLSSWSVLESLTVLEDMSFRGHDIKTDEIRSLLEIGVVKASAGSHPDRLDVDLWRKFCRRFNLAYGGVTNLELEIEKIHVCAELNSWEQIWDIWHRFPAEFRRRPKELFITMLQELAKIGHQAKVQEGLRSVIASMEFEEPAITLDADIADGIKACLGVIRPEIDEEAADDWNSNDEWLKVWRRCEVVKQEENRFLREYDDD